MTRLLRTRGARYCILAVLLLLLYLHITHHDGSNSLESVRLHRYMNDAAKGSQIISSPSSFDWANATFTYPIDTRTVLPKRASNEPPLPRIQHRFKPESQEAMELRKARRSEVKRLFRKNWQSYKTYAWKKDALKPISAGFVDQFSGWAATLVDSLDTLWIMGMKEEFYEALDAVADIDFGKSSSSRVNMFETNIRYLGGLLAAYDLSHHPMLLMKATELGDLLLAGFNTPNNMPVDFITFNTAKLGTGLTVEGSVVSASPGTLSLEFTHLSQVTGDNKYYAAVSKVMDTFGSKQNETKLPGMWPMYISMSKPDVTAGFQFTIGGNADSLYEYLPKEFAILGGAEPKFETMSRTFMETARKYLFFRPMLPKNDDILISGNVDVNNDGIPSLDPESEHLSCFIGGLYALGGRIFSNENYVEIGEKLTRGCIYAYRSMPTGMMPERYNMVICPDPSNCQWDEKKCDEAKALRSQYKPHLPKGFTTAKDPRYILRPEAIESVFVSYRVTGKQEYQEAAWDMFEAIRKGTQTPYANAAVMDVTEAKDQLEQEDYMEVSCPNLQLGTVSAVVILMIRKQSFWLAETLKYFYLVFSPPDLISLDDFVLNTEAHPFRRPK